MGGANIISPHGKEDTESLLARVNQRVQQAVSNGDYKEVQRLARIAEGLSVLAKKEAEIAQSRQNLSAMIENSKRPLESETDSNDISSRERGNRVRFNYVENVLPSDGIRLQQIATKFYRTADGRSVGIAYAKELTTRPSFWFLGLADEQFDWVILLCESSEETGAEIAALVFPPEFVRRIWKTLSRSKGQVKFHVARTGYMSFDLRLPGSEALNISQYLNATQSLKKLDSRRG